MKVLALGCCLLALLALGQAQGNITMSNDTTPMPATTAQATPVGNNTVGMTVPVNSTSSMVFNNGTTMDNNSTLPTNASITTPHGGGPDVKASLLFSVLPLVLYAVSL